MAFLARLFQLLLLAFVARRVGRFFGGGEPKAGDEPRVRGYAEATPEIDLRDAEDAVFEEIEER